MYEKNTSFWTLSFFDKMLHIGYPYLPVCCYIDSFTLVFKIIESIVSSDTSLIVGGQNCRWCTWWWPLGHLGDDTPSAFWMVGFIRSPTIPLLTANLSAMPLFLFVVFFASERLDHEFSIPCLESSYDALVQRLLNGCCVGWEELELNMAEAKFMNNRWGVVKEYQDVAFLFFIVDSI